VRPWGAAVLRRGIEARTTAGRHDRAALVAARAVLLNPHLFGEGEIGDETLQMVE